MKQQLSQAQQKNLAAGRALLVKRPQMLPARVAYTIGGGVVPNVASRPDMLPPVLADVDADGFAVTEPKRVNGLTYRADCMARWVAHGSTLSDAFRLAYSPNKGLSHHDITTRANKVARRPSFSTAVQLYRERVEEESRQTSIPIREFVTGRLVVEAQEAKTDAARVASLRLLGMTEGMFTTVHKRETTLDPKQLDQLKAKLDQRLRETLARLGGAAVPVHGPDPEAIEAEILPPDPHSEGTPLNADGSHATMPDTIPLKQAPDSPLGPLPAAGPIPPDGSIPESVAPEDPVAAGYASDFDGPLILQGGLREP